MTPLEDAQAQLDAGFHALTGALSRLDDRLTPVLRPLPPTPANQAQSQPSVARPCASRIVEDTQRRIDFINEVARQVDVIADRLEC